MSKNITVKVNISKAVRKVHQVSPKALPIVTQQILKDSNIFIPADTWNLRDSSLKFSDFNKGKLIWKTRYAKRLYKGVGFRFSKDKNPRASAEWYEVAKLIYGKSWVRVADRAVKSKL